MSELLTPAAAARRLGVGTHTMARWAREGRIAAVRTAGGHRRYRAEDLEAFQGNPSPSIEASPSPSFPVQRRSPPVRGRVASSPVRELEVSRETAVLAREMREADREAEECEAFERREEVVRESRGVADRARGAERERLDGLKAWGRAQALFASVDVQADVVRDLETFVTVGQFPSSLAERTAHEFIAIRVQQICEAREEAERDGRKVDRLIDDGIWRATLKVFGGCYGLADSDAARAEVECVLRAEVCADWTAEDVIACVERTLDASPCLVAVAKERDAAAEAAASAPPPPTEIEVLAEVVGLIEDEYDHGRDDGED